MKQRVLALFAKAPAPGQVKTRLVPPLSPVQAAELYEAMLRDILDQHAGSGSADRALWYTPADALPWFQAAVPASFGLYPQLENALPARMAHLFRVHAREGYREIVLRGTDSPTLPLERVENAFEALARVDLVLCPDRDGGYNLIGLREPRDELFGLEMSTASVLAETLERARATGLRAELLPAHYDVDTAEDLRLLRADLAAGSAPRTARWLAGAHASIAP